MLRKDMNKAEKDQLWVCEDAEAQKLHIQIVAAQ